MSVYYLFPSEAVLLGLVAGEFERLVEYGEQADFDDILYRRLRPFVPDPHQVEVPINEVAFELPSGYFWADIDGNGSERSMPDFFAISDSNSIVGDETENESEASPSEAKAAPVNLSRVPEYVRRDGKIFRIDYVHGKRNLIDLIIEHLRGNDQNRNDSDRSLAALRRLKTLDPQADAPQPSREIEKRLRGGP